MKRRKKIYGVGINDTIGLSDNKSKMYQVWTGMMERCYSTKYHEAQPTYIGHTVCESWKYYSNFVEWYNDNYKEGYALDKDIIIPNNTEYSPDACSFVPPIINSAILTGRKKDNGLPCGVTYHKAEKYSKKPYETQMRRYKKLKSFGYYETPEEAHAEWQRQKSLYLKELLSTYYNDIDARTIDGINRRIKILEDDLSFNRITKTINKV